MVSVGNEKTVIKNSVPKEVNYTMPLVIIVSLYFMIGFITVMNDVLIPALKGLFQFEANETWKIMLIQFSFFIAYGLMSIPSGYIIHRIGYKNGLILSLSIMAVGLLLFVPASIVVSYVFFLFALFIIALGLALLQVAINPYITALGSIETASARMNVGGALNSLATFMGPIIGAAFILNTHLTDPIEKAAAVRGPYIVLAFLTFGIALLLYFVNLPKIEAQSAETTRFSNLFRYKHLMYGSGAIFFYVGAEVAIGSLLILYLQNDFGINERLASGLVAYYWGSAMIGRLIGSLLGEKISAQRMLAFVSSIAGILILISVSGVFRTISINVPVMMMSTENGFGFEFPFVQISLSILALISIGFLNSVMWPCIFPLSIRDLGASTSKASGWLITMVAGGAFVPFVQGLVKDQFGYNYSFLICLMCYVYIYVFAVNGYKTDYLKSN
jgi:MFS transporter, FHS family, L-fucose permease